MVKQYRADGHRTDGKYASENEHYEHYETKSGKLVSICDCGLVTKTN